MKELGIGEGVFIGFFPFDESFIRCLSFILCVGDKFAENGIFGGVWDNFCRAFGQDLIKFLSGESP